MLTKYFEFDVEYAEVNKQMCPNGNCSIIKTAEERPADIFDGITIKKNHAYLYVIAMGAGDYFGENKNGDFFWEKDLIQYYKKFLNAGVFIQHNNKNPDKSIGKVLKSIYNNKMHRVELLIQIQRDLAPDIYEAISNGERIAVSMGVKVPSESCSYCGQVTKGSIANRCDHLKFHMHELMPNGIKVAAINHPPLNFFDISVVRKPADHQGYALFQKVASVEEDINNEHQISNGNGLRKLAELTKRIDALASYNPMSYERLTKLRATPSPLVKNFLLSNGILLHPSEYMGLFNKNIGAHQYGRLSDALTNREAIHDFFSFIEKKASVKNNKEYIKMAQNNDDVMEYLLARNELIKVAANTTESLSNSDSFGNRDIHRPRGTSSNSLTGFKRFALIKANFNNGDTVAQPTGDFYKVFEDMLDNENIDKIYGVLPNGQEVLIGKKH